MTHSSGPKHLREEPANSGSFDRFAHAGLFEKMEPVIEGVEWRQDHAPRRYTPTIKWSLPPTTDQTTRTRAVAQAKISKDAAEELDRMDFFVGFNEVDF